MSIDRNYASVIDEQETNTRKDKVVQKKIK